MQLPLNISLQQILLHWMNLAILVGGLYFLLFEPVKKFMDQRAAHYQELDRQAEDKLAQAERLKADCQAKLDRADEEIRQERARAQQASALAAQEQLDQANEQARHFVSKAIAAGIAVGLAAAAGAISMGIATSKSTESIARQPEAEGKIRTALMLGLVFIETAIIYALLVVILIIFVL